MRLDPIVVPVDFSEACSLAVEQALRLAERPEAVIVLHVVSPPDYGSPGVLWGEVRDARRVAHAEQTLRDWLVNEGHDGTRIAVKVGVPAKEIARFVDEVSADLLVIAPHTTTTLERFFLGSVAERAMRLCRVATWVIRPPQG